MHDNSPSAMTPAKPAKRRNWARRALISLILLGALAATTLSRSLMVPASPAPSAATALATRQILDRVRRASERPGAQPVSASQSELTALGVLGGRALGLSHSTLAAQERALVLRISKPLPLGFWVNLSATVESDADRKPRVSARIGHLPVPSLVVHGLIRLGRFILRQRGIILPPLEAVVHDMKAGPSGVTALLDLPRDMKLVQSLYPAGADPIDPARVRGHYCRLVAAQAKAPDPALSVQVKRAFGPGTGSVEDNRAVLIALAMVTVSPKVARLIGDPAEFQKACGRIEGQVLLLERADLAKHWALSAALSATFGVHATAIAGTWKEIADSGPKGSGFSYVDLAADRAGTRVGERASSPAHAAQTADWLRGATDTRLLPIATLALAEGMSEADFIRRYRSINSAAYGAALARIDRALDRSIGR